jgi:hypothetical protein
LVEFYVLHASHIHVLKRFPWTAVWLLCEVLMTQRQIRSTVCWKFFNLKHWILQNLLLAW